MSDQRFREPVTSLAELTRLMGEPSELARRKQLDALDEHMIRFIAASPFVLIGTTGADGTCDVSPRGDAPGVARVADARTLLIADRRGNRRVDSLRNIVETGRAGLLFLIPGLAETLRVNGRAKVIRDEDVRESLKVDGKAPVVAIVVEVEECYLQCGKAVIRSKLWEDREREARSEVPGFARMLVDQTKIEGQSVESLERQIEESYRDNLY